jgi:PAS domain S-box-containing protein
VDAAHFTEEQYRLLLEQAAVMIWRTDAIGRTDYYDERWLAFSGRTLQQELRSSWVDQVHPDDRARCVDTFLAAFAARRPLEMTYRRRRCDGVYRLLLQRGAPFHDQFGEFAGYIGTCVDITENVSEAATSARARHELLPVCASCKRIRDASGNWLTVEAYVAAHYEADCSHSICPDCLQKLYPELAEVQAALRSVIASV